MIRYDRVSVRLYVDLRYREIRSNQHHNIISFWRHCCKIRRYSDDWTLSKVDEL